MQRMSRRAWGKTFLGGVAAAAAGCAAGPAENDAAASGGAGAIAGAYPYLHLDVFTERMLTGNQLAVFLEPAGLGDEAMQRMAREINFSETTFIFPAESDEHDARLRIFGRNRELPFAGHPTIGSAFAMAHAGLFEPGLARFVFGEGIGPIPVDLDWDGDRLTFAWMGQLAPTFGGTIDDAEAVEAALGVDAGAIASTNLPIQEVSCGSTFMIVPMATRALVDGASVNRGAMEAAFTGAGLQPRGLMIFSSEAGDDGAHAYSRMLGLSGFEDPATGSAAGPLGSYLVEHEVVAAADASRILSAQGVQMNRPSQLYIDVGVDEAAGAITRVRVGGVSVVVGDGTLVA
jgi:trans-2,3-dihydro-3-hydroxyanthranilate isomerase